MLFSTVWRRLILVTHVMTSVGFPGAVAAFLVLAIVGVTDVGAAPAAYIAMAIVTWDVIVPLAAAALLIGIVTSLGTPWGLVRFYWVIVKLVLTVIALAVLLAQTGTIDMLADTARRGDVTGLADARAAMILHAAGGLLVLIVATVLSIYKPRGLTPYGRRKTSPASSNSR